MMKRVFVVLALTVCSVMSVNAQTAATAPKDSAGTMIEPSKSFDGLLKLYEGEMMGVVKAMPAEKYNFAPSAAIFVPSQKPDYLSPNDKGVRTFGQMVGHVAQANYFFYGSASGLKPDVDVKAIASLTDKDKLVEALQASFEFGHKAIATLTAQNAFEAVKGFPDATKASAVAFGIAHGFDHYGQLAEYLRMNGLVPPASTK
jgi:uncharacterized damage-inducible protein DinB